MRKLLLWILALGISAFGQDGSPDLSFGEDGVLIVQLGNNPPFGEGYLWGVDETSSGNIIAYAEYNFSEEHIYLISLTENGQLDTSWGIDGFLELQDVNPQANGIFIQNTDKILIKNRENNSNGLYRILPNESIDSSFGIDGYLQFDTESNTFRTQLFNDQIYYQSDKIVGGIYTAVIEKYTPEGVFDTVFGTDGILEIPFEGENEFDVLDFKVIPDGSLLLLYSEDDGVSNAQRLIRFDESGSLDTSYGMDGSSEVIPAEPMFGGREFLIYPDGSSIINFRYYDSFEEIYYHTMFKVTPDGYLDTSFGNQGEIVGYIARIIQENGRILSDSPSYDFEGGYTMDYHRLYQNGFTDTSFDFDSQINGSLGITHPMILDDGSLLIASSSIWYNPDKVLIFQKFHNSPLGIEDFQQTEVSIAPNPSEGIFQIDLSENWQGPINYVVTDISGKEVASGQLETPNSVVDLSLYETGMYFLKVQNQAFKLLKS